MKEHKQNIALAQELGWTDCEYVAGLVDSKGLPPDDGNWYECPKIGDAEKRWLPRFDSLDVIHKVEKILVDKYWKGDFRFDPSIYIPTLTKVVRSYHVSYAVITASAEQRREAILKTLNLWEESR